jgi:hypothetical protein
MEDPKDQKREESKVAQALVEGIRYGNATYRIGIIVGQCFGGVACLGGLLLIVLGLSGQIDWILQAGAFSSRLANASPGALFAVIGLVILWRYKPIVHDDLSVRPGSHSSSLRSKLEEIEKVAVLERSWKGKGDDIDYHGSR